MRRLQGTLARLHLLYRWEKGSPEKQRNIPKIPWLLTGLETGTQVFCLSSVRNFHPAVGWQCRVIESLCPIPPKSHNKKTKYFYQQVYSLWQHANSSVFSLLGWSALSDFSKILLLLIPGKLKCLLRANVYWALTTRQANFSTMGNLS